MYYESSLPRHSCEDGDEIVAQCLDTYDARINLYGKEWKNEELDECKESLPLFREAAAEGCDAYLDFLFGEDAF